MTWLVYQKCRIGLKLIQRPHFPCQRLWQLLKSIRRNPLSFNLKLERKLKVKRGNKKKKKKREPQKREPWSPKRHQQTRFLLLWFGIWWPAISCMAKKEERRGEEGGAWWLRSSEVRASVRSSGGELPMVERGSWEQKSQQPFFYRQILWMEKDASLLGFRVASHL